MNKSKTALAASLGGFGGLLLASIAGIDIFSTVIFAVVFAFIGVGVNSTFENENPTQMEDFE